MGYHCIVGGVTLPNDASVRLHDKPGLQPIGIFKEVGYKFNLKYAIENLFQT